MSTLKLPQLEYKLSAKPFMLAVTKKRPGHLCDISLTKAYYRQYLKAKQISNDQIKVYCFETKKNNFSLIGFWFI